MRTFLCRKHPIVFLKIYAEFIPNKDYESRSFKVLNTHYLKYISEKEKEKEKEKGKEVKNTN